MFSCAYSFGLCNTCLRTVVDEEVALLRTTAGFHVFEEQLRIAVRAATMRTSHASTEIFGSYYVLQQRGILSDQRLL
jgi:hypothetical protein